MTVIDLFAGPGGWDMAARDLGLDPIGVELDDAACETRLAAGLATVRADVAAVDDINGRYGPVTGLLASPPCQAFSTAGKQKGKADIPNIRRAAIQLAHGRDHRAEHAWADDRAPLVLEPLRWALALRPEWMCWEQVPPVLPFWELCGRLLAQRGYSVWTGLLHAEQFGVPQTRKRAFLIASRVGAVAPPAPTHSRYYPRDKTRLDEGVEKWVSMAEALGWGPDAVEAREWAHERPATTIVGSFNPHIVAAPGYRTHGGHSRQNAPGAIRVTVEQAAILQSFPADYPWQGSRTKQFEQVGNAVPPGLARPVLEAALASAGVVDLEVAA